ncbi:MAG TPA: Na+/H+ antiporter NhaA [Caulobacteraceae bacterium]|nr:Na+/H+ antiporter NhaA [Caulobacteraceae bacterium]
MTRKLTLDFLRTEAASGAILALAALTALLAANSPLRDAYFGLLKTEIPIQIGGWREVETFAEWVKEGLMAIFFFVVGLEIKYEVLRGELSNPRRLAMPVLAAVGGMVVPALVYVALNANGGDLRGWSVPVATDIAFALAALAVVGRMLPPSLRIFLLTLAIADDLGAVAIIALVYSRDLHLDALAAAVGALGLMWLLGRLRRPPAVFYVAAFLLVWAFTLESGISTSLAGVFAAMTVPIAARVQGAEGPLKNFMETLHPWVAYLILPLFAFCASGFSFAGLGLDGLTAPVTLGIALGLFFGKQIGVFGAAALAVASGLARKPSGATWLEVYGVAALCGIGFTMSLFLGALAFPAGDEALASEVKLGVIGGSLLSALAGVAVLSRAAAARRARMLADQEIDATASG